MDYGKKPKERWIKGEESQKKKSARYSINEGIFHSIMIGVGESFISPFAIFLKATTSQLALLSSLPQLFSSLFQLFVPKFLEFFKSRKKIVATGVLLQALVWLPILYVFYLNDLAVPYLIFLVVVYWIIGKFIDPVWNSWMGDLVDNEISGRYFGFRNKVIGIAALASLLVGGLILNAFPKDSKATFIGFVFIFVIAFIARLISFIYVVKKYEPKFEVYEEARFSFVEFVKKMRFRNYGLFVIYLSLMNFAVYIASPFFSLYMLQDLKFSYVTFTIISASSIFARIIFMPFWGKMTDKYGAKKILAFTGYLMPLSPLLWLLSNKVSYIMLFQFYSGMIWAGFELSASSFIFDSTTSAKRARCIAYYNVINGVMILLGTLFGALLVKHPIIFSSFLFVFFVSGILRCIVSIFMLHKIKEVRTVDDVSYGGLFVKALNVLPTESVNVIASFWKNRSRKF